MYKTINTLIILLAAVTSTGCRSAKPMAEEMTSVDSVAISSEKLLYECSDSTVIAEESENRSSCDIRFVEGGGSVSMSFDGSMILSGVAEMNSSRQNASEIRGEKKIISVHSQSKDFFTESSREESKTEPMVPDSISGGGWKLKAGIVALLILILAIILISKKRQTLINHYNRWHNLIK